ncbi:kinase-like domain-containing protein [Rhizoctonia solani]|nr:kinase-like domain-containing protein [Rhizoctonia solani]
MRNGSLIDYLAHESSCNRMKLCIELAEIVEYLHGKGIVHGDIKADNVLVSDSRDARLADFGSATLDEYRTLLFTSTLTELPCSIRFAAPEILDESSQKHTAQSDIYALGMTILQILTGKPPYAEMSNRRVLANVFRGVFPPKPELDGIIRRQYAKDELWNLLLRCWKHDPNLRPTATVIKRTVSICFPQIRNPTQYMFLASSLKSSGWKVAIEARFIVGYVYHKFISMHM